jgi:hypothetical protein
LGKGGFNISVWLVFAIIKELWTGKNVAAGFSLRQHRLESLCHQNFTLLLSRFFLKETVATASY